MKNVPVLDIRRFRSDREAFVHDLGEAYREFGFGVISGHGISPDLISQAYDEFKRFFALPTEVKMRYHVPGIGGSRGYTPYKLETAKGQQLPDLKEFFHIGRELDPGQPAPPDYTANAWPLEVPQFKSSSMALYRALAQLGDEVLSALALHINLPANFFADKTNHGNSVLRAIHYPPIPEGDIPNVRAAAHEDINFITLLVGASAEGLELLNKEGKWLPVVTKGDAIVVNIGDMLQRMTNHVYPSTTHRVVNPPGEKARQPRYSVPFFLHPNRDLCLDPLPETITPENPNRYEGQTLTAREYLDERLREIRLK